MRSNMVHRVPYANSLQQNPIQQIPNFDMAIQGAGDKLVCVVWIQDDRCNSIRVASSIPFCREGRYNEPSRSRVNLHAGTDNREKVTESCAQSQGIGNRLGVQPTHLPSLVKTGGCLVVAGSVMETHCHDFCCSALTDVLASGGGDSAKISRCFDFGLRCLLVFPIFCED